MIYFLYDRLRERLLGTWLGGALQLLDQIEFRALAAAGLAFLIVLLLGKRTIRWLVAKKIGDSGMTDAELYRAHAESKANTPTMGGLLVSGAIAASVLLLADVSSFYVALALLVLVWLSALGAVDDWLKLTIGRRQGGRQGLYAWEKLLFQLGLGVLVGIFVYTAGDSPEVARDMAHVLNLPLQKTYDPRQTFAPNESLVYLGPVAFVAMAVLMIAGMSNAVNITDGMDGLAGGIAAAVSVGLLVLTLFSGDQTRAQYLLVPYVPGSGELAVVCGAMLGACLGFLWWNCYPAQVFMGDTGSLSLGGLIAYVSVVTRQECITLVMCGIFLMEIGSVVLQVGSFKLRGKRIFRIAPIHHHFHLAGWPEQRVVGRFWVVTILLVIVALASVKVR